ncbi:MAG: DUF4340 domain-containing protein [Verrucomicrobia bacterium]|nr:DUF4340 domain-containing protein [Verrucomicrobiota bacterium]
MRLRTTLTLVAIALGLATFIYLLDRRSPTRQGHEPGTLNVVDLDLGTVSHLLIQNGESNIELVRDETGWMMQQPLPDRADTALIEQLLDNLALLRCEDELVNFGRGEARKQRLREFGLFKPKLRLRIDGAARSWELSFGSDTAVEGRTYLRVQGKEPIYVVSSTPKEFLTRKPDDFRDHRLTPFLTAQIDRVELRLSGGLMVLHRTRDDWEMDRPIKARASNRRVAGLLARINDTTIEGFADVNRETLGEVSGQNQTLTLGAGDQQVALAFDGDRPPDRQLVAISNRPGAFLVNQGVARILDLHPNDLRDRQVARFNPDLVDRISINSGQQAFTMARRQDQWVFADDQRLVNPEAVSRLIQKVTSQDVEAFVTDAAIDLGRYGLEPPERKIAFASYASENTAESNAGELPLCTLLLGKSENGAAYARLAEEPFVFSIADSALASWPLSREEFQSLDLLPLERGDLVEVTLQRPGEPAVRLARDDAGKWQKEGVAGPAADTAGIQAFLSALVTLRAERWLAPSAVPENRAPVLTITLRLRGPDAGKAVTLQLGPPADGGARYGTVSNLNGTFLVGPRDFAALERLTIAANG